MTVKERIQALIAVIVPDIVDLLAASGDLSALTTTAKGSFVAAINELQGEIQSLASSGGAVIDDAATSGNTTAAYSADKVLSLLASLESSVKADILGPDTAADLDTIKELATELLSQDAALGNLLTAVGNTVRFTAQPTALTAPQQAQARTNIAAGSADDVAANTAALAELDYDFAAEYVALRDA